MPVFSLDERMIFPPAELAEDGLLAVGGDLSPERLLLAYSQGIFPWYDEGQPILWHSPDPRMVLRADELHVSRRLARAMRRNRYRVTFDTAFAEVIEGCAHAERPEDAGTWIHPEMIEAYTRLHELGYAHCAEAWIGSKLAGGIYGVSLGAIFFGESMYTHSSDASKTAFVILVRQLAVWGIPLIDCQVHTDNLARFGAREWPRRRYLDELREALKAPTRRGPWGIPFSSEPGEPDS